MLTYNEVKLELHEHFVKQTYRNRCTIYGANGKLDLIVPLRKWKNNTPINEIRIAYDAPWQKLHWRSIVAAYRSSPYFEFYEDELHPFFHESQFDYLHELNTTLLKKMVQLLGASQTTHYTGRYEPQQPNCDNMLDQFSPKRPDTNAYPHYHQVFESKYGFIANLSILDLLFNMGPQAISYIKSPEVL
jgi:hypothetical protein